MPKTFDPKCYELAEYFLEDDEKLNTQENRDELSARIQTAIENFIAEKEVSG